MEARNYVVYHLHSDLSLLDSCTKFEDYIMKAVELGQKAICFTEHGNIMRWVAKKEACDKAGIKYLHGCEVYLTAQLEPKVRDNYHTVLIAKNMQGLRELNQLISTSNTDDHFYFKPRITFDEFLNISDNVIKISACLASPLARMENEIHKTTDDEEEQKRIKYLSDNFEKILLKYDYYEIQPHINSDEQKVYNKRLFEWAKKYNKPLIAGTDTHSINRYKAECRSILQLAKGIEFANEDQFDLTYKSYDELVDMFAEQNALPKSVYLQAIENTNVMADSCEDIVLDKEFKYPKVYDDDIETLRLRLWDMLKDKVVKGIIPEEQKEEFVENIKIELAVFKKINMCGFMLFMSDLIMWCHENNIPTGFARGSCGGSCIAYVLDIIDINPIKWKTVFSRFANEDRKEIGDIDVDFAPDDRDAVYNHMIEKFGEQYTAYILAIGTVSDKGCIDEIGRALHRKTGKDTYLLENMKKIKKEYEANPDKARETYDELFYYFDGLLNTNISQSMHPCGMVVSPVTLEDNYGTLYKDDKKILQIDMEDVHEISLVKYDILGLKNVGIIKDACKYANITYPKSSEVNWDDQKVWEDMLKCPQGIFQFEGAYAFQMLCEFKPKSIFDMSLVTAALRPSGSSYRDKLMQKEFHKNPSEIIDNMLEDNYGYLIYQEDTIKFLKDICGLTGSEADNIRRAIGRKQKDRLDAAMPSILEGYCKMSPQPRDVAEQEAKEFLQIIEDSASYQFGYNHSVAYCMVGYLCAYLRYYHTPYFIMAYLNNAQNEDDIVGGFEMAKLYGYQILPPRFRHSTDKYMYDEENHNIYKGVASIKYLNSGAAEYLYSLRDNQYDNFISLLEQIEEDRQINSRQMEILIQLQYFDEFGKNKKLLETYRYFKNLYGRKTIAKDKLEDLGLIPEDIVECFEKETEKQYTNIDYMKILANVEARIPNEIVPITEQVLFEADVVGYISMVYDVDKRYCLVTDVDTKYSPRVRLYSLGSGKETTCKINKITFNETPFKRGQLIKCGRFYQKDRQRKTETGWESTGEKDWWLANYELVDNLEL
jgi:DNA polymerase-3 subunit alpha